MSIDYSFLKFYKTLLEAVKNDDSPAVTALRYGGFIVQKPNEVFTQTTNLDAGIGFVGGIKVELVTCDGVVHHDITDDFYYDPFIDSLGKNQITFSFGNTGINDPSKLFHLKITDLTNDDVWYSFPMMFTDYNTNLSTRFDYFNVSRKFGIAYDLQPYHQSIRIANCFKHTPANKDNLTQYVTSDGKQVNYEQRPTFLKTYKVDSLNEFINDRLQVLFSHGFVYIDGQRAVVSELKTDERKGTSSLMSATFTVNFQDEFRESDLGVYEGQELLSLFIPNGAVFTRANNPAPDGTMQMTFSKVVQVNTGHNAELWLDGSKIDECEIVSSGTNVVDLEFPNSFTGVGQPVNGQYYISVPNGAIVDFGGIIYGNWGFEVTDGDYDRNDYDEDDYLTN